MQGKPLPAMPYRRLPNTLPAVLRTLTTARDEWLRLATTPDDRLPTDAHWAKLDPEAPVSLLNRLRKETSDVDQALATQAPLTDATNRAVARETLFVSHFHQVYDFGVARGVFSAGGRAFYGRDVNATTVPDLASIPAVLAAGAAVVQGEADRQRAEGARFVPMALPSAAEVGAIHAEAEGLRKAGLAAQTRTDREQNEVAPVYAEAQKLAVSICNTVEFRLNEREDLDAPGRRRIARRWGVVYLYDKDETPDPDDANAANLTLAGVEAPPASNG